MDERTGIASLREERTEIYIKSNILTSLSEAFSIPIIYESKHLPS